MLTRSKQTRPQINRKVKKDEAKVVNSFDIEDLAKDAKDGKIAYCRCWKSKKVRNHTSFETLTLLKSHSLYVVFF